MASNAPVSGLAVQTAEKAKSSELAQKLPARLSGLVQFCLAEIFRVGIDTPRAVADVFVEWSPHVSRISVRAYLGGWRNGAKPDFEWFAYVDCSPLAETYPVEDLLCKVSEFVAGAWILAGGKGGAL